MRKLVQFLLAAVLVFGWNASAFAESYTYEAARVKFEVPNNFKKIQNGQVLTVVSPSRAMSLTFDSQSSTNLAAAASAADKQLNQLVTDLKYKGQPQNVKVNGLPGQTLTGSGKLGGKVPVVVNSMILVTPSKRALLIITLLKADSNKSELTTLRRIINSIQAA